MQLTFRQGSNMPIPGERKGSKFFADLIQYSSAWRHILPNGALESGNDGLATLKADGFPDFSTLPVGNLGFGLTVDQPEAGANYGSYLDSGTYRIQHANAPANSVRFATAADAAGAGYTGTSIESTSAGETLQGVDVSLGSRLSLFLLADGCDDLHVYFDGEEPGSNPGQFRPKELGLTASSLTPGAGHIRHMQSAGVYTEDLGTFEGGGLNLFGWSIPATFPVGEPYHKDRSDLRGWINDEQNLGKSGWALQDMVSHANQMGQPLFLSLPLGYLLPANANKLAVVLQYVNDNALLPATIEGGSENWNSQFTPFAILNRDRGGLSREVFLAQLYDALIVQCRSIDPAVSKLRVYLGGQTGFGNFLRTVLQAMDEPLQSAGTAPYFSPNGEDVLAWKGDLPALPSAEQVLDSCIGELELMRSAMTPHVNAIAEYESRLGITIERIAYEGGYAWYSPAAFRSVQRAVLSNPNDKLKALYRVIVGLLEDLGYDEVVWYNLIGRFLVGNNDSIFGHGETFSRELLTDPNGENGTQSVADQHQAKAQIVREWLPQFVLNHKYDGDGGAASFDVGVDESRTIDPIAGATAMTGDAWADIAHPWDRMFIDPGAPALPAGVAFDSAPTSPTVGRFTIDGGATSSTPLSWTGDVVQESDLSGNVHAVSVTLNFVSVGGPNSPGYTPGTGTSTVANGAELDVAITIAGTAPIVIERGIGFPSWASIADHGNSTATLSLDPPIDGASGSELIPIRFSNSEGLLLSSYAFTRALSPPTGVSFSKASGTVSVLPGESDTVELGGLGPAGPYTFALSGHPSYVTVAGSTMTIAPPIGTAVGAIAMNVTASNADGPSSAVAYSAAIADGRPTDILFSPDSGTSTVVNGEQLLVALTGVDPGQTATTLALASGAPGWASIVDGFNGTAMMLLAPSVGTALGVVSIDVEATNVHGTRTEGYSVTIAGAPPTAPTFNPGSLTLAAGQQATSQAASTGDAPVALSIEPGAPAWITIDGGGLITAAPPGGEPSAVSTITVTASSPFGSSSSTFSVGVTSGAPSSIMYDPATPSTPVRVPIVVQATADGDAPLTWGRVSGPAWGDINSATGLITFLPPAGTAVGDQVFRFRAWNSSGGFEKNLTLEVLDAAPSGLVYGAGNRISSHEAFAVSALPVVIGAVTGYAIVSGTLPAGLGFDGTTGLVAGTLELGTLGTSTVTIEATGPGGTTRATVTFVIGVSPPYSADYPGGDTFALEDGDALEIPAVEFSGGGVGLQFTVWPPPPTGVQFRSSDGSWAGLPLLPFPAIPFLVRVTDKVGRSAGFPPALTTVTLSSTVTPPDGGGRGRSNPRLIDRVKLPLIVRVDGPSETDEAPG